MKVKLYLEKDDNEYYGLRCNKVFDSFWSGTGIFHDVFEHWFENNHKYWFGDVAYNRSGEIAAMGAHIYFMEEMYISNRYTFNRHSTYENALRENLYPIQETLKYTGEDFYGESKLMHNIPYQNPVDNSSLENLIEALVEQIKDSPGDSEFKKQYNFSNISRLKRWGYNQAKKLVPNNGTNTQILYNFIESWENFCNRISAEKLFNLNVDYFEFTITKERNIVEWEVEVVNKYIEGKDLIINSENIDILHLEDFYEYEEEY